MAYVITQPCVGNCETACVTVCPVDAIAGPLAPEAIAALAPEALAGLQFFIDPGSCISCGSCAPECPVRAIFEESEVPASDADAPARNAAFFDR